jgi:hypothetical protein
MVYKNQLKVSNKFGFKKRARGAIFGTADIDL